MHVFKYLALLSLALAMTSIAGCDDSAHRAWVIGGVPMGPEEDSYTGPSCTPACGDRVCGPDPVCGESCGTCDSDEFCDGHGQCIAKPDTNIEWVRIAGGTFEMGSNDFDWAQPVHSVTVPTFEMTRTEVTVEQYKACVDAGACTAPDTGDYCNWGQSGRGKHPINCVDWHQAQAYAKWAGGRLPTEAEWEYAAKAGISDNHTYGGNVFGEALGACGDQTSLNDIAWYCLNSGDEVKDVVQKLPNPWGLYDTLGNVGEWVDYYFHSQPLTEGTVSDTLIDPFGPKAGTSQEGQQRDSSYKDTGCLLKPSEQTRAYRFERLERVGFRPVRTIFE